MNIVRLISTPRLELRTLDIPDAEAIQALLSRNKDYMHPWVPWAKDEPQTVQQKREAIRKWKGEFLLDQKYVYGVYHKPDRSLLGLVFLFTRQGKGILEIGYIIDQSESGRGFATEASYAAVKLGLLVLQAGKMAIHCSPENTPSVRVSQKLGFHPEGSYQSAEEKSQIQIWILQSEEFKLQPVLEPVDFVLEEGWE